MAHDDPPPTRTPQRSPASLRGAKGDPAREARVKAALKANIARRKAQAQARDTESESDE